MGLRKFATSIWKLVSGSLWTNKDVVIDGDLDLSDSSTNNITLPVYDNPVSPAIEFGAGGHGIYSSVAANINMSMYGVYRYNFTSNAIQSAQTSGFYLQRAGASGADPAFAFRGDEDCGMGRYTANCPTLCGGGTEIFRAVYDTSVGVYSRPIIAVDNNLFSNPTHDSGVLIQASKASGEPKIEVSTGQGGSRKAVSMSYRHSDGKGLFTGYDYDTSTEIDLIIQGADTQINADLLDVNCYSYDLDASQITADSTGDIDITSGDEVTITATTKITLDAPALEFGAGQSMHKTIALGEWNMPSDAQKSVLHGLSYDQITGASAMIYEDGGASKWAFTSDGDGTIEVTSTSILLTRSAGGFFDDAVFDATTGFNRGYVVVHYDLSL